jgi:hypothetical protein
MDAEKLLEIMEDVIEDDTSSLNEKCKSSKKKITKKKKVSESAAEISRLLNSLR